MWGNVIKYSFFKTALLMNGIDYIPNHIREANCIAEIKYLYICIHFSYIIKSVDILSIVLLVVPSPF